MVAYADTSFLVSLYGQDANSASAQEMAANVNAPLAFTPFLRHEARNAIRLAFFRKEITADECRAVIAAIETDTKTGALVETPVAWAEVYAEAEALSAAHTGKLGTRAADVLHVAAAAALGAKHFYTFDTRQKALAAKVGMKVKPWRSGPASLPADNRRNPIARCPDGGAGALPATTLARSSSRFTQR